MTDADPGKRLPATRWWHFAFPPDPRRSGHEPDYRFSFANERTFLAWIRTSLALTAGGLGILQLLPSFLGREILGILLLGLGLLAAASSYRRWAIKEQALRAGAPLPPSRLQGTTALGVAVVAAVALVLIIIEL